MKVLDKEEEVKIGFSSVINRSDRNLEKEIVDLNLKRKRYCKGNHFLFIDNDNINELCLNNSKLLKPERDKYFVSKYKKVTL